MNREQAITSRVVSEDGTAIEYLSVGGGPGLVLIPGSLAMAADLLDLADLLSPDFTVHIIQRRGRGASGPQSDRYGMEREREDVAEICARTGARLLFGHSFGGLIALQTALSGLPLDAIAVYEPGVSVNGSIPTDWIPRARTELDAGDSFAALLTFIRGVNPEQTGRMPRWILRPIIKRMIPAEELAQNLALLRESLREHVEVGRFDGDGSTYSRIGIPTLILHGGRRASANVQRLGAVVPNATVVAMPGLNHFAPEQKPQRVAQELHAWLVSKLRGGQ